MKCRPYHALSVLVFLVVVASNAQSQSPPRSSRESNFTLAVEDTVSFSHNEYDTLLISAPRVKVEDVIKAIGERIERDENLIKSHEFTVLATMILHKDSDPESGNFILYESAERRRIARGESVQSVLLWDRERIFKDGELDEEKHEEEEFKTEWHDIGQGVGMAQPFSTESGDQYKYEIEDRHIVGNNVVYKILFKPKSDFDALPSGTVWVDFSDLVLRRIEASFIDPVPYPLFLKAVPFIRITQRKLGDFWVADEVHTRIELRDAPLPKWPSSFEMHTVIKDQVINGVAYNDDGSVMDEASEGGAP